MTISKGKRFRIFERDNFACKYCGAKAPDVTLEVDHVHPRAAGGTDHEDNLVTACWACNRGKRDLVLEHEWVLDSGPNGAGPMDGQTARSRALAPAMWVFRCKRDDGLYTGMDEVDLSAEIDGPYCTHIKLGANSCAFTAGISGWGTSVVGIYLPFPGGSSWGKRELYWIGSEYLPMFVAGMGPNVRPCFEPESEQ